MDKTKLKTFSFNKKIAPINIQTISIDTIDACNLACKTCPRGQRFIKNTRSKMEIGLFKSIIQKASNLCILNVCLYDWTEPFLCDNLEDYTKIVHSTGLICILSSNLSFRKIPSLIETLKYCDKLIVSVSGFNQEIYKINHRGGNIEFVKNNLKIISDAKKSGRINTKVEIRYFIFDYSEHEFPLFEKFAHELGLDIVMWKGGGNPHCKINPPSNHGESAWLKYKIGNQPEKMLVYRHDNKEICSTAINPLIVNHAGDVFLCCLMPNFESTKVGNFLEDDLDVLQYRRSIHPMCNICTCRPDVINPDYHKESIMRGLLKDIGGNADLLSDCAKETDQAEKLAGREVYFWGCGQMLKRKKNIYASCKVEAILADLPGTPAMVIGMPVRTPEEELGKKILPIIIFAGESQQKIISEKIRSNWPEYKEIYYCSTK